MNHSTTAVASWPSALSGEAEEAEAYMEQEEEDAAEAAEEQEATEGVAADTWADATLMRTHVTTIHVAAFGEGDERGRSDRRQRKPYTYGEILAVCSTLPPDILLYWGWSELVPRLLAWDDLPEHWWRLLHVQCGLIEAAGRAQLTRASNLLKASAMFKWAGRRLLRPVHAVEECSICLEPPSQPSRLPCGHIFCWTCVQELRRKGVSMTCPLCRADLPPCSVKLNFLGQLMIETLRQRNGQPITASHTLAVHDALLLLCEAMDQVTVEPVHAPAPEHCW